MAIQDWKYIKVFDAQNYINKGARVFPVSASCHLQIKQNCFGLLTLRGLCFLIEEEDFQKLIVPADRLTTVKDLLNSLPAGHRYKPRADVKQMATPKALYEPLAFPRLAAS